MAVSGSQNFKSNRDEIIIDALTLLGVYGVGRTVSADDMTVCKRALNKMIKKWSADGLHLWCKEEGVLYFTQYQAKYSLGNAVTDAMVTSADDEITTQLNGALALNDTAVTVDSTAGMTVGDNVGIILSDNSLYWTTILTIPTSTTLTLTAGVTGEASNNAIVFTFTNRIYKPLRVLSSRLVNGIDSGATTTKTEVLMNSVSYQDYFEMPSKTSNGTPNEFHYNPRLLNGNMYIWLRPNDCNYRAEFTYERVIDDLDTATDDFDLPAEWEEPVTWQLAVRIAPAFGKGKKMREEILPLAIQMKQDLMAWDSEINSVSIMPDMEE